MTNTRIITIEEMVLTYGRSKAMVVDHYPIKISHPHHIALIRSLWGDDAHERIRRLFNIGVRGADLR